MNKPTRTLTKKSEGQPSTGCYSEPTRESGLLDALSKMMFRTEQWADVFYHLTSQKNQLKKCDETFLAKKTITGQLISKNT
uniref:Uncharacterized protein n=1 Tax=Romanomermis culicivorax TaxID=13658 RepID=A0A915J0M1_ROMCU